MGFAPAPVALDPAPGGAGGALVTCRGLASDLLRRPYRSRVEHAAHASLTATWSSPEPPPTGWSMPERLRYWPRRQLAAAQLCSSTAGSHAPRPRDSAATPEATSRPVARPETCAHKAVSSGLRLQTQCRWACGAGEGGEGTRGSNGPLFVHACASLRKLDATRTANN